ncbi:secondary thiamine-phosphate synthase enzyme YjbQ [Litoribacter alkaliphilus]|uniref:Secondary thiamine-phosphate synthase enzyme YjbQ n=1 Tax=Litoribacter ruber TaxID=702568 RepID=A0AAP2G138_9BACT|nr:secondary thiamine-phosphate synthase enzyme YjbQ [Litoribacter alkaliphilus]MBS9523477.1 secondary thiamine-phosphate synthase enzyme YjbQ [Litoribacter alkaliphilus]
MKFYQETLTLPSYSRGFHLITEQIVNNFKEIRNIEQGMLQIFLKHTSAGLTINENADPDVRKDFETFIRDLIPDTYPHFIHTAEGPDDMPAHIKTAFFGNTLTIPITQGKLNLGTWQGIYLCEFRNRGGNRKLVMSAYGK